MNIVTPLILDIFNFSLLKKFKSDNFIVSSREIKLNKTQDWNELINLVSNERCKISFKLIFDHFYPLIFAQAIKSRMSKEVACELAQESMIRVWSQSKTFDATKGNFSVWIFIIARNVKFDYLRKIKNERLYFTAHDIYGDLDYHLEDEILFEDKFDLNNAKHFLEKLSVEQSDIIHKIYFEGMTQQEVSEVNGIPIGTVKSRIRLALATLRDFVEEKSK